MKDRQLLLQQNDTQSKQHIFGVDLTFTGATTITGSQIPL